MDEMDGLTEVGEWCASADWTLGLYGQWRGWIKGWGLGTQVEKGFGWVLVMV